jgi:hypothetical protein
MAAILIDVFIRFYSCVEAAREGRDGPMAEKALFYNRNTGRRLEARPTRPAIPPRLSGHGGGRADVFVNGGHRAIKKSSEVRASEVRALFGGRPQRGDGTSIQHTSSPDSCGNARLGEKRVSVKLKSLVEILGSY